MVTLRVVLTVGAMALAVDVAVTAVTVALLVALTLGAIACAVAVATVAVIDTFRCAVTLGASALLVAVAVTAVTVASVPPADAVETVKSSQRLLKLSEPMP
jgi:hypothetical protein